MRGRIVANEIGFGFLYFPMQRYWRGVRCDWDNFFGFGAGERRLEEFFEFDFDITAATESWDLGRSDEDWREFMSAMQRCLRAPGYEIADVPLQDISERESSTAFYRAINDRRLQNTILFQRSGYWVLKSAQLRDSAALMRQRYWQARATVPINTSYSADNLICAVHIRRDDIAKAKYIGIEYYVNLFADLAPILERTDGKFYISTDGTESDIREITDRHDCTLNFGGDPRVAFHDMACADLLVPTISSFSVIAGRVSTNLKLFHGDHQEKDLGRFLKRGMRFSPDWMYIDENGCVPKAYQTEIERHLEHRKALKSGPSFLAREDWPDPFGGNIG